MYGSTLFTGLGLLGGALAAATGGPFLTGRQESTCFDSANNPGCWTDNFNIDTNYYKEVPPSFSGPREYNLVLENKNVSGADAPDGFAREIITINGKFVGEPIVANWGDDIIVHVTNKLTRKEGTSIHFHGIRQLNNSAHDGVVAVTQCPIAVGETMTYKFRAEQYGTSWYHSHYALQPWDGAFGPIIIHGPATAPYDEDLGAVPLGDWHHRVAGDIYHDTVSQGQFPPAPPNGLIGGKHIFNCTHADQDDPNCTGEHLVLNFKKGLRHRLRFINHAIDMSFKVVLPGHTFKVIATDFVPIEPFDTDVLSIGIGQRLDVIVEATQEVGNYWLHSLGRCGPGALDRDIRAIVRYDDADPVWPADTGKPDEPTDCNDLPMDSLKPKVKLLAGESTRNETFRPGITGTKWHLGPTTFRADWGNPTVEQIVDDKATNFTNSEVVIKLDEPNKWTYFIINAGGFGDHPIHLHGHDFWILSQGLGNFAAGTVVNITDKPRRDVAMLPNNGHLVIGFPSDNPGVWLMHCHIGWHASLGFALQLVERINEIPGTTDMTEGFIDEQCVPWRDYASANGIIQDDSGIRIAF